jgi:enterochelin esterase family protein
VLTESTIHSQCLGNSRRVWLQPVPDGRPAEALCVLLDGEYYVDRMNIPPVIAALQATSDLPACSVAYVSHVDGATRWRETVCHGPFADFVATELFPWLTGRLNVAAQAPIVLGGLSLTGLTAAHAALRYPDRIAGVICQSASFWWADCWLVEEYRKSDRLDFALRMSCGSRETTDYVEHGPNLIQKTSQLTANRALYDIAQKRCSWISYEEYEGGHDLASWRLDLPRGLMALLAELSPRR